MSFLWVFHGAWNVSPVFSTFRLFLSEFCRVLRNYEELAAFEIWAGKIMINELLFIMGTLRVNFEHGEFWSSWDHLQGKFIKVDLGLFRYYFYVF